MNGYSDQTGVKIKRRSENGRNKPLLLKDIRDNVIESEDQLLAQVIEEFTAQIPIQRPIDERVIACIIGCPIA